MRYKIGNDTPVWLRRTVWFVYSNNPYRIVETVNGRRRFFKSEEAAQRLADKLNTGTED